MLGTKWLRKLFLSSFSRTIINKIPQTYFVNLLKSSMDKESEKDVEIEMMPNETRAEDEGDIMSTLEQVTGAGTKPKTKGFCI